MGAGRRQRHREDDQPTPDYTSPLRQRGHAPIAPGPRQAGPAAGQGHALHRAVRGPGHADRRHRPGDPAGADGRAGARARTSSSSRPTATGCMRFTADGRRRTDRRPGAHLATNLASASGGATVDGVLGGLAQHRQADRRHRGDELGGRQPGRRQRRHGRTRSSNVDLAGGQQTGPVGQGQRHAAPGRPGPGRGPGAAGRGRRAAGSPRCGSSRSRPAPQTATSDCSSPAARRRAAARRTRGSTPARPTPSTATEPRPLAPDLLFRRFDVPGHVGDPRAAGGAGEPVLRARRSTPGSRTTTR